MKKHLTTVGATFFLWGVNNGVQQHINFIFLSLLSAFMATGNARECYILYCSLFNLPALF
ncbi:Uncharacterised protein [Hafnia alvei]|uniref:Uncharacterized protein n=1 Tax=Hafnia alvei TaxID=569 RepID=A0A377PMD1_HAFAL|nr:Uncharacterised protein [Hafnia alvei]